MIRPTTRLCSRGERARFSLVLDTTKRTTCEPRRWLLALAFACMAVVAGGYGAGTVDEGGGGQMASLSTKPVGSDGEGPAGRGHVHPVLETIFAHPLARTLAAAAETGEVETIRTLVANGADVDEQGVEGASVLMWAIVTDSLGGARALLDAGADPNLKDDLGNSPLHLAATKEDPRFIEVLVAKGADVNAKGRRGVTALMIASLSESPQAVRLLLAAKADVAAADVVGRGALHYAAIKAQANVIRLLLEAGAKTGVTDEAGLTPADLVPENSNGEAQILLARQ